MEVTFLKSNPNIEGHDIVQIDDAHLIFCHFSGAEDDYHQEGERDFSIRIDDPEIAEAFMNEGFNVTIKQRDNGEPPYMRMKVKVGMKGRESDAKVFVVVGGRLRPLNRETIAMLDGIRIERADMEIRAFDWERNGRSGRSAWLNEIKVYQQISRFEQEYAEQEFPGEEPFPTEDVPF